MIVLKELAEGHHSIGVVRNFVHLTDAQDALRANQQRLVQLQIGLRGNRLSKIPLAALRVAGACRRGRLGGGDEAPDRESIKNELPGPNSFVPISQESLSKSRIKHI